MPPIFFSPLLFKKTQIQLYSLKTTTLKINLSLFNIISVHFHRFGPPFNNGMYSSPVKSSRRPACHSAFRQPILFVLQLLYSDEPIVWECWHPLLHPHTHFSAFHVCEWAFHLLQSINHRTLSNRAGIHALVKRCTKTVEMYGDYIEKWQINCKCCGFQATM